jgi:hypothetical protein
VNLKAMSVTSAIWKPILAGLCGSVAHSLLMFGKSKAGILPEFRPYETLQMALIRWTGAEVHPLVPWLLSYANGSIVLGFLYGRIHRKLPGSDGLSKGLVFGLLGWAAMGFVFFPLLGLGLFAFGVGLGAAPALFTLAMVLTYSVVLGLAYATLDA